MYPADILLLKIEKTKTKTFIEEGQGLCNIQDYIFGRNP